MPVELQIREAVTTHGVTTGLRIVREGIQQRRIDPNRISLRGLAQAFLGDAWEYGLNQFQAGVRESQYVDASHFAVTSSQLLIDRVQMAYDLASGAVDGLFRIEPITNGNLGTEIVPIQSRVQNRSSIINQGMPYPRTTAPQHYVTMPASQKYGGSVGLTKEMIYADKTQHAYKIADSVGEQARLFEREQKTDVLVGAVNPYVYDGTAYNTYRTSGSWINDKTDFVIADETDIDELEQLFVGILDPITGVPIKFTPKHMLVMPSKRMLARRILNATTVTAGTDSSSVVRTEGASALESGYELHSDAHIYQRAVTSLTGLTTAKIKTMFIIGDFKKAFVWRQAWPLAVQYAGPGHWEDFNCDVPVLVKASGHGVAAVDDPRYVVRGYNNAA